MNISKAFQKFLKESLRRNKFSKMFSLKRWRIGLKTIDYKIVTPPDSQLLRAISIGNSSCQKNICTLDEYLKYLVRFAQIIQYHAMKTIFILAMKSFL
ncbi:MAG: hypothetical protein Q4D38_07530, partial [Planctomycetia bacterium]|nr:hypothetical protein [Planctomycetia bacterium]